MRNLLLKAEPYLAQDTGNDDPTVALIILLALCAFGALDSLGFKAKE
jgi:hypothetical protein